MAGQELNLVLKEDSIYYNSKLKFYIQSVSRFLKKSSNGFFCYPFLYINSKDGSLVSSIVILSLTGNLVDLNNNN